jgi:hypothetical protein
MVVPNRQHRPKSYGPFYLRAFVSIMMVGFLLLFTVSGVALFVSPPGQLANTMAWTLVGLSKGQWETLHIAFGFLWIPLALAHLVFNRRVLTGYLRDRARRAFVWRRELVAALAVTAVLGVGAVFDLPPVAQLMAWEESFAGFWAARAPGVVTAPPPGGAALVGTASLTASATSEGAAPGSPPAAPLGSGGGDPLGVGTPLGVAGGAPASAARDAATPLGGGMGRYVSVDPETGVAQPVGKEAAARLAASGQGEGEIDQE